MAHQGHGSRALCALAIGGLDPGGGAGIAADLRAFAAAGVFGCAAVSLLTVQSTHGLRAVFVVPARRLVSQAEEVVAAQRVRAIKVGAMGSAANVREMAGWLARRPHLPVVVDTVLAPTLGRERLLQRGALTALKRVLLPRATLITANALEAEALMDQPVRNVVEARVAAMALVEATGARAALVKGGHLQGPRAVDVLAADGRVYELAAPRLRGPAIHGSGCALASLIAGRLAAGEELVAAIRWAKRMHHVALSRARDVGGPQRVLVFDPRVH
jgi:hydroxymethylpyrimidine/phosphomethylpyrimidine kinase